MPTGKPTRAPLIIFGAIIGISIVCVMIVFAVHSQRTEPYLDVKMRRVKRVKRAPAASPVPAAPSALDAGSKDAATD